MLSRHGLFLESAEARADKDDPVAEFEVGKSFYFGNGVPQDYSLALFWYKKSAQQGNNDAEFNVASMYEQGEGTPQNYAKAIFWYRKAADDGHPASMWNLAEMYRAAKGMPKNDVEAYFWMDIALSVRWENMDPKYRSTLTDERDQLASQLNAAAIRQVQERAQQWAKNHSAIGGSE